MLLTKILLIMAMLLLLQCSSQFVHAADRAIPPQAEPFHIEPDVPEHLRITGSKEIVRNFKSEHLNNLHDVVVYLPQGFDAKAEQRYPVLYTIGWDSLFITGSADPVKPKGSIHSTHDSIPSLLKKGAIRPFIMVCVSPDLDRTVSLMDECAPTYVRRERERDGVKRITGSGGRVHQFARFMIDEVKPWVDSTYPTLTSAADTGITGISKWGMGTLYIAMNNPKVFGMWGGLSPALRWDHTIMARLLLELPNELPLKVWMSAGAKEGGYLDHMDLFKQIFLFKGIPKQDVEVLVVPDAGHSGETWDPSVGPMLRFMFPVKSK